MDTATSQPAPPPPDVPPAPTDDAPPGPATTENNTPQQQQQPQQDEQPLPPPEKLLEQAVGRRFQTQKDVTRAVREIGKSQNKDYCRMPGGGNNWCYRCRDYFLKKKVCQEVGQAFDPSTACPAYITVRKVADGEGKAYVISGNRSNISHLETCHHKFRTAEECKPTGRPKLKRTDDAIDAKGKRGADLKAGKAKQRISKKRDSIASLRRKLAQLEEEKQEYKEERMKSTSSEERDKFLNLMLETTQRLNRVEETLRVLQTGGGEFAPQQPPSPSPPDGEEGVTIETVGAGEMDVDATDTVGSADQGEQRKRRRVAAGGKK